MRCRDNGNRSLVHLPFRQDECHDRTESDVDAAPHEIFDRLGGRKALGNDLSNYVPITADFAYQHVLHSPRYGASLNGCRALGIGPPSQQEGQNP